MLYNASKNILNSSFIVVFFVSSFLFDGFKKDSVFYVFFIVSVLLFYLKRIKIPLNSFFLFVISSFISTIFSDYPDNSLFNFFIIFLSFLFYSFSFSLEKDRTKEFWKIFKDIFYFFSIVLSFFVSFNYLKGMDIYYIGNNHNYPAFVIGMGVILSIYRVVEDKKGIYLIGFFTQMISIFMLNSRACYFSILITGFVYFIFKIGFKKSFYLLLLIFFIFSFLDENIIGYFLKLNDPKAYYRPQIFLSGIKAFLSSPLWGWGGNSFEYIFEKFKFAFFDGYFFYNHSAIHPHNEFINIAVEKGVVGFLLYLFILKDWLISKKRDELYFLVLYMSVFSLFCIVLMVPFFKVFYFLLLGYFLDSRLFHISFRSIILIVLLFILSFWSRYEINFKKYDSSYSAILTTKSIYRKAAVSEYSSYYNPYNPVFLFELSRFYYITSNYKTSMEYAKKSIRIEPYFNNAYLMMSMIEFKRNNINNSYRYFLKVRRSEDDLNFYSSYVSFVSDEIYYFLKNYFNTMKLK